MKSLFLFCFFLLPFYFQRNFGQQPNPDIACILCQSTCCRISTAQQYTTAMDTTEQITTQQQYTTAMDTTEQMTTQEQYTTAMRTTNIQITDMQTTAIQTTAMQTTRMQTSSIQTPNLLTTTMASQMTSQTSNLIQSTSQGISNSKGNNSGIIVGIIVGVLLLLIILCLILWFIILRKKRKNRNSTSQQEDKVSKIELEETSMSSSNVKQIKEIKKELVIIQEIGKGKFGLVYKGKLGAFFVACKKLQNQEALEIEKEVDILSKLEHPNIVAFIGLKKIKNETYMVMEYMNSRDLLTYLRTNESSLQESKLMEIALQVSNGMKYLEQNHIIHKDLAARNVLCNIDDGEVICKISDFGLSKVLENYYYEQSEGTQNPVPVKWSAPELIFKSKISSKSDVFSFGVVLFEIFSKGNEPWGGYSNPEVIKELKKKNRMDIEEDITSQFIKALIHSCWKDDPHERPTFADLYEKLEEKVKPKPTSSNKSDLKEADSKDSPLYHNTPEDLYNNQEK